MKIRIKILLGLLVSTTVFADKIDSTLGKYAGIIATNRLAKDASNEKALILLKYALCINPDDENVLLTKGLIQRKMKPGKIKTTKKIDSFLNALLKRNKALVKTLKKDDPLGYLCLLNVKVAEVFKPDERSVILQLVKLGKAGFEGELDDLLDSQFDLDALFGAKKKAGKKKKTSGKTKTVSKEVPNNLHKRIDLTVSFKKKKGNYSHSDKTDNLSYKIKIKNRNTVEIENYTITVLTVGVHPFAKKSMKIIDSYTKKFSITKAKQVEIKHFYTHSWHQHAGCSNTEFEYYAYLAVITDENDKVIKSASRRTILLNISPNLGKYGKGTTFNLNSLK
ncbi:MAG: hypothetical protein HRT89_01265 [Lentisphaeria bacterium]|nr:hypothetical protein [Lentisphaeria bacterium]NQZ66674.1 hypothetical protein [Lentisphaeria bacterium]